MSNLQKGTFNTIANTSVTVGGGKQVWARVEKVIHFGRLIDLTGRKAGDVIPAGSMVHFDNESDKAEVIKATDTEKLTTVNGLILNDVCIPEGAVFASCAIVTSGKIWADATDVPKTVEAQLPNIEFIRERKH
jgi:hypothetical protein